MEDFFSIKVIEEFDINSKMVIRLIKKVIHTEIEYKELKEKINENGRNKIAFILLKMIEIKYNKYQNAS